MNTREGIIRGGGGRTTNISTRTASDKDVKGEQRPNERTNDIIICTTIKPFRFLCVYIHRLFFPLFFFLFSISIWHMMRITHTRLLWNMYTNTHSYSLILSGSTFERQTNTVERETVSLRCVYDFFSSYCCLFRSGSVLCISYTFSELRPSRW